MSKNILIVFLCSIKYPIIKTDGHNKTDLCTCYKNVLFCIFRTYSLLMLLGIIQGVRIFDRQHLTGDRPYIFIQIEIGTYSLKVLNFQNTGYQSFTFIFDIYQLFLNKMKQRSEVTYRGVS